MSANITPHRVETTHSTYSDKDKDLTKEEAGVAVTNAADHGDYSGFTQKTDPREIKLVRKLDIYIMTSLWSMYWLNYLDRNAIALAKLSSLTEDLRLTDVQYQTCVSILFVGYVIMGVPSNMFITRTKPSIFLVCVMMTWAIISICTAFSKNFMGLLLTRFFLGVVEAPYYPGALLLISNFYTRTEVATRIAILYTGNILATAFAGLIALGIFKLDGVRGLAGWQWLFIIQGAFTGLVALCAYPFLPDSPLTTRWLTPEERQLAHDRLQRDNVDRSEKGSTLDGLKQAVTDPRVWLFCLIQNLHLSANGFKNFFPSVIKTLGLGQTLTLVLTCPPYLIAGVFSIVVSLTSGKYNERTWHITVCKAIAILGFALAPATLNVGVRYFAMMVFTIGTYGVNSIVLGWAATVCSQSIEKKAVTIAMMTSLSNASFIYTPYLFKESDKPRYTIAMTAMAAFSFLCAACCWGMRIILKRQNKSLHLSGSPTITRPRTPCPPLQLCQWCADSGIPYASLLFSDETRLDRLYGAPLPSDPGALATFEDTLMSTFVSAPDFDNLNYLDRDRLSRLYERYRRLPNSVNDDQLAFLYAVFCLSRFNQLRTADNTTHTPSSTLSHPEHIPREDLTYFHRACQAMTRWGRPSVWSLWGLSCLVPYSIATAGPAETDFLLDRMVMHVRELGIHQRETAALYPSEDMVGLLFSAFFYMDTMCAGLMTLQPRLTAYELDFDPTPLSAIAPGCLAAASLHQAHFLNHVGAHPEDLASKEYIASTISTWNETLYALRRDKLSTIPRVKRAMQVLLLTPGIATPEAGSTSLPLLARVTSQILSTFAELASLGHLSPAWPQVRQIVACGHLVVVCTASGELHQLEARRLVEILLDVLGRFAQVWPSTVDLVVGFRRAADSLGLGIAPEDMETPLAAPLPQGGSTFEEINQWLLDFPFDFDISSDFAKHIDAHEEVVDSEARGYVDHTVVITPEVDARLRRKIHLRILPLLCLGYLCQALDKGTITSSSIMGWLKDVNAKGQDFSLTTTILWCGIIMAEPLANQCVRRLPLAKLLAGGMVIWSILLFGLGFSMSIPPVLAIRFLLGFFESLVGPCLVALMVQWYRIEEQPFVGTMWQCMLGLSTIITSLLAYGFFHIENGKLKSWQWLHVMIGLISLVCSLIVWFFLPDSPTQARWATEEEKTLLVERVRANNQGLKNKTFNKAQMREAFKDSFTWCLFFLAFFNTLVVGGVSTFGGLLITRAFGFSTYTAQLLNIPVGVFQILLYLSMGWLVKKTGETAYLMVAFTIPNIVGTVVLLTVAPGPKTKGGLVAAYYCMMVFGTCYPAIILLLSRNVAGQTKKSVVYAVMFMGWAGGNGISPQIFQSVWAPRYLHSLHIHLALYGCFIGTCFLTRFILARRNKRKEEAAAAVASEAGEGAKNLHAFEDLTDLQNPDFRYSLLKRKVDLRLMPCLFVLLILNYLDRNALSLARVQGIEADLGLKGNNFNTAISVLFCGYIIGQLPSNLVLSRVRPSVYLSVMCVLWGIVSAATAAANNFGHLVVVRFFLGVLESPFFPGALFLLSSWYTKKELALRTSILYCGSYLSGAFAGLIAAGVQKGLKGKRGLTSWQWLFILEGSITVLAGLVAVFILPDYPATTRWLTDREKALAAYRLERDTGMLDKETMPLRQAVKAAVKDYKLWMFALIYATMATAGGYSPFVPTVVNTFGLSPIKTLLLTAPPFLVPVITQPIVSFFSDRGPERCWHYTTPMWFAIVGFILAATTTTTAPRYLSIFFLTGGLSSSFSVLLAWVGSTFARPRTKRAAAYGIINALGNSE
ncbi:putative transporter [Vanrija pseudolonga]|uniref:Purtative transporter n=1 Tax=Vanrija pseudolonga TaxID=143232 RepID=A0AAF1BK37_9TREE|nr:purtative transporter [Vanrija pseudolonga]